jgi:hypothetical protein
MGAVIGRVVQVETGAPVANLVVAAFDLGPLTEGERPDLNRAHRPGSAVVSADGSFRIGSEAQSISAACISRRHSRLSAA